MVNSEGSNHHEPQALHVSGYFREEPTSHYSQTAVSVKAAVRQAKATCRGLPARPRKPLHVATVENLDVAGWTEGRSMRC